VTAAHACVQVLEFLVVTLFDLSPFGEGFKVKKCPLCMLQVSCVQMQLRQLH
jgi:hypothetical protein